ncbi:MAG: HPr(Ser) kinase/phosphatase [bacterium]
MKASKLTVKKLLEETKELLGFKLLTQDADLKRIITEEYLHRPGVALAGFVDIFSYQRIQIFGNTELAYLKSLSTEKRKKILKKIFSFDIPCVIVTSEKDTVPELIELANSRTIPVLGTAMGTIQLYHNLGYYLKEKFAPATTVHGCLVDIYGIGILITGRSGIGKSELALDLVTRGHRFVCDDVVGITRMSGNILLGKSNKKLQYNMEIRGLGIINIQSIFGIKAIRRSKRIEVELKLVEWEKSHKYERLGIDESKTEILGLSIPIVHLPIFPGKSISTIAEVIALNELCRLDGQYNAKKFSDEITRYMKKDFQSPEKYIGPDFE